MRSLYWILGAVGVVAVLGFLVGRQPLKALSYFMNDPRACVTCHVMEPQFESWYHSAHRAWAGCNDCHVPKHPIDGPIVKAQSAARHAYVFFIGTIPERIRIAEESKSVAQGNCLRCHNDLMSRYPGDTRRGEGKYCFECHRNTPHGR